MSKVPRAASLAWQLFQRRASIDETLRAHRFLFLMNYAGRPGELEALRRFEKSGYTYDDFSGALWFARACEKEAGGTEGLHRTAWSAAEGRAQALTMFGHLSETMGDARLENLFLDNVTLVTASFPAVAAQACRILRETRVGGEILQIDVFDSEDAIGLFQTIARVRALARRGGLELPKLRVVAVLGDPIVACAAQWQEEHEGADGGRFQPALEAAIGGDGTSPLAECFRRAIDGAQLVGRVQKLLGEEGVSIAVDSAAGFAEHESENGRCFVARLECLHVLGLHLKSEDAAPVPPFGLQAPRAIESDPKVLDSLRLTESTLERAADLSTGSLGPVENRAAWVRKWSFRPESERQVYVFPHIPKTAGSSLAHHFREHLKGYGEYVHVRHDTDEAGIRRDLSLPFYWRDARLRSLAKVIFGHGVKRRFCDHVPGSTTREIITLREPAERMISHYNFWMHVHERRGLPQVSFDEWYAQEPRNYQVFWIAYNYLEMDSWVYSHETLHGVVDELLEKFWMVSTLTTFDRDMELLMRELGLPNVGERKNVGGGDRFKKLVTLTDDLRARLRAENPLEYQLYDKWLKRSQARHAS